MNALWITLTVLAIFSQVPHAYWSIMRYSQIEVEAMKVLQAIAFCMIISVGILCYVLIGKHEYALGGAVVEIIVNLYYYNHQFKGKGLKTMREKLAKHWLAYFLALLLPLCIYFFSREIVL